MQLIDSANAEGNLDVLLQMCLQSCDSAYDDDATNIIAACRFGCSSQLPMVRERRQRMAMLYNEADQYIAMLQWLNSVVTCLNSRYESQSDSPTGDVYLRTRVVVFSSSSMDDRADVDVSVHGQTAVIVEGADWPSAHERFDDNFDDNRLSRNSIVVIWGITFFLLTFFTLGVFCPSCFGAKPIATQTQKLSIYGDGEFLKTLDEADEELLVTDKGGIEQPQVLLMKIPIHTV